MLSVNLLAYMRKTFLVLLSSFFLSNANAAFDSADFNQAKDLEILRITPEGEGAEIGNQIVIEFNQPVVPVGVMERKASEIPVEITPKLDCEWRWLNTSSLSCNLDEEKKLQAATKYKVKVNPGIKTEAGSTIASAYEHSFTTQVPDVYYVYFNMWASPTAPSFRVMFNQPVIKSSVEKSLYIQDANTGKEYSVSAEPVDPKTPEEKKNGKRGRGYWYVTADDDLPLDSTAVLKVRPGLEGIEGTEKGNADREIANVHTHPEFKFLGVKCSTNAGESIFIKTGQLADKLCNPLGGISIAFSGPVSEKIVRENVKILNAQGKNLWVKPAPEDLEENAEDNEYKLRTNYNIDTTYDIWLPDLRSSSKYKIVIEKPEYGFFEKIWRSIKSVFVKQPGTGVSDLFGRYLMEGSIINFGTDNRAPNFVIANDPAVLESGIDSEVPLYIQNIDSAYLEYNKITASGTAKDQKYNYEIPKDVRDIQFAIPFDVRKMLGGKSGAIYGLLSTMPYLSTSREIFAQVTPYQVHAKIGHFNSFVWVTEFATGKMVENASVTIYKDKVSELNGGVSLASAVTDKDGVATLAGMAELDPKLTTINNWNRNTEVFFVKVQKGEDIALLPLHSEFEEYSYGSGESDYDYSYSAYPSQQQIYGHIKTWGTTAQGIYHAGDTIQYKIYVRNQDAKTLVPAPKGKYKLEILDPTDNVVETVENIELNEFGALSGEYTTGSNAKVGWYSFRLSSDFIDTSWYPARVLVSDFTPAPFKVTNQLNGELFNNGDEVKVQNFAKLHSGGPYTDANVRVTAILSQKYFEPEKPILRGYNFSSYVDNYDQAQVFEKQDKLNDKGEFETSFKLESPKIYYGNLMVETAVQDDRGKSYAGSSSASFAGVDRFIGVKMNGWVHDANKQGQLNYAVIDAKGNFIKDVEAVVAIEKEITTVAKVKGAGNAYTSEYNTSWLPAGGCKVNKTLDVPMVCRFTPKSSGYYRVVATVKDSKDAQHQTIDNFYVTGSDYVSWHEENDTSLSIVPEKSSYKVGDVAKYMVKNPYPGATALVTVERYGVIDHFVKKLDNSTAIIELPIKPDYLPGFYMSVTIFSPRVDKPIKDQVDMGKPAYRSGYVTVPVNDEYKQMVVTASTDKKEYRPREKVTLDLKAEPKFKTKNEPIEFAVAVLDEAVLDLVAGGKNYYNPYKGLYELDSLDMRNFNLLMRLVGRQKFEKKGANPGGDGGSNLSMRDVFKYVSYWNPSIKADANGEAAVDFELPDNLTGWRVLAIATTPTDRVGLGDYNFKTNKKTEIQPAMPNQITEGDSFDAAFTVMNRTDKPRDVMVKIETNKVLLTKKVTLAPYKRELIKTPIKTTKAGELVFKVYASDALDKDAMTHKLIINKRRSLETSATYGTTEKDSVTESLLVPKDIYPDVGGISIVTSPTVIGNVDGAFEYMRDYPYMCWEQKLTKAVMSSHYVSLNPYLSVVWNGAGELPQKTLDLASQYQAANGGMAYFVPDESRVDPYLSAYTALSFNWLKAAGYKVPQNVEDKLHAYLENFLRNENAPDYYDDGMKDTIRAVALNALAGNGKLNLAEFERYHSHFKNMSLFGKTNYLNAALSVPGAEKIAEESAKNILSYANQSGGKFTFTEKLGDAYSRMLSTPTRENCAVLSAFVKYGEGEGASLVGDVPFKLVRTITQARGSKNYWENTQENMFCMNALIDYARVYEKTTPDMQVNIKLDSENIGSSKFTSFKDKPVSTDKAFGSKDMGRKFMLGINRVGDGRLYYSARMAYALKAEKDKYTNAGIEIKRTYSIQKKGKFEELKMPAQIKQGDLIKVDIYVTLPAGREFVVVDDPVPGGLEPVNRDLANTSALDAASDDMSEVTDNVGSWLDYGYGYYNFYHKELRNDRAVFYSDYLDAGKYHLSYTAQAIASGQFTAMPVKAEEMYDPDVYGKGVSETFTISQ